MWLNIKELNMCKSCGCEDGFFYQQRDREEKLRLIEENKELKEQLRDENIPVKYYRNGGYITAVYGSSSIAYVETLRKAIKDLVINGSPGRNQTQNFDNAWRELEFLVKEGTERGTNVKSGKPDDNR
jgi:hypothetical protein